MGITSLGARMRQPKNNSQGIREMISQFQQEVVKTGIIGKKMLTASRTNAHLKETYEELGRLAFEALKKEEFEWYHPRLKHMMQTIEACQKDLEEIENQVQKIKFSSAPEDISRKK